MEVIAIFFTGNFPVSSYNKKKIMAWWQFDFSEQIVSLWHCLYHICADVHRLDF